MNSIKIGFSHISVLLNECIEGLNIKKDGYYMDLTAGGGGHSSHILNKLENGKLLSVDQDPTAIAVLNERLGDNTNSIIVESNFSDIDTILNDLNILFVDGILMDLGVSSHQLDNGDRGFSYNLNSKLDMRMSQQGLSAYELVNTYSEEQIVKILFEYGEEKFARRIAQKIIGFRKNTPIETTFDLVDIIKSAYPSAKMRDKHPAKKTFQAIRIAVNDELGVLSRTLDKSFEKLNSGGRLCVITFHSLEDRIVKQNFVAKTIGCICPKDFPICICNNLPKAKIITRKPILPTEEEIIANKRSKSAKLRILEKL